MRSLRSSSGRSTGSLARPTSCGSGGRRASSATRRTSQLPPISVPRSRRPFLPPILSSFSPPPGSRQPLGRSGSGDLVRAEATRPALHRADGWHPLLHEYETRRIATLLADSQLAHRPRKADAPVARRCTPQGARFQVSRASARDQTQGGASEFPARTPATHHPLEARCYRPEAEHALTKATT